MRAEIKGDEKLLIDLEGPKPGSENCCAVCTNEVAKAYRAIEMHSRARASGASAARFDRPARQATEPRAKREAMSALCHGLVVDSTFERSENFAITW